MLELCRYELWASGQIELWPVRSETRFLGKDPEGIRKQNCIYLRRQVADREKKTKKKNC